MMMRWGFRTTRLDPAWTGLLLLALVTSAAPVHAQWGVWSGDSLLAAGRLGAAESSYYQAVRANPRDPIARAALGKYLAARGGTIAGAILLEEARDFGGDSAAIARALAPLYAEMYDFAKLDALKPDLLSAAGRRRVQWLAKNPPTASFPDSIVLLTYRPSADGDGIGTVMLRLGRTELPAVIDPRVSGLLLPTAVGSDVRSFGSDGQVTVGTVRTMRIGAVALTNVPATVGDYPGARIGFEVLSRYSPSFNPVRGIMVLRREPPPHTPVQRPPGTRVATLFDPNGMRLLIGGRWQQTSGGLASMLLASRAWMWDMKRGDVVLLNP